MVIDDTGSVEDIHAFIYCAKWTSGQVSRMPDRQTTLKDRATQLLIKYKSGALVTQCVQKRAMHPASQDKKHFNPSRQPSQAFVKLLTEDPLQISKW